MRRNPAQSVAKQRKALRNLLDYITSGRRYTTQNPYTVPEIEAALRALKGEDWLSKAPARPKSAVGKALVNLVAFRTSGRSYETQNPYTIPEVQAAMTALGRTNPTRKENSHMPKKASRKRAPARRRNTHIPVGSNVVYHDDKMACVTAQAPGDHYEIKFASTGALMTVPGHTLQVVKGNPWMAFERHGGEDRRVAFFAHKTRQKKEQTGRKSYKRGGQKHKGRGAGRMLVDAPEDYAVVGRGTKAITKAAQAKKQRAAWKRKSAAAKEKVISRLRAGHAHYLGARRTIRGIAALRKRSNKSRK